VRENGLNTVAFSILIESRAKFCDADESGVSLTKILEGGDSQLRGDE